MLYFVYKLVPPRPTFDRDMTGAEAEVMQRHAVYWRGLAEEGTAVIFGPVADPAGVWGVAILDIEMKNVEIPASMQRAMAQEAEALREKRARVIKAEAELDAARNLHEAAAEIMQIPAALELRRRQMLTEIGAEQNTMTVVMMPSEFVSAAKAYAEKA